MLSKCGVRDADQMEWAQRSAGKGRGLQADSDGATPRKTEICRSRADSAQVSEV